MSLRSRLVSRGAQVSVPEPETSERPSWRDQQSLMQLDWEEMRSTNVKQIAYDRRLERLHVEFARKEGTPRVIYRHDDVPEYVVQAFRESGSPGRYFRTYLKDQYVGDRFEGSRLAEIGEPAEPDPVPKSAT